MAARKSKKKQVDVTVTVPNEGEVSRIPSIEELVEMLKEHTEIVEKGEWAPIASHVLDLILAAVQEQIDGADTVKTCRVCAGNWESKLAAVKGAATKAVENVSEAALDVVAETKAEAAVNLATSIAIKAAASAETATKAAIEAVAKTDEATKVTASLLVSLAADVEALQVGIVTLRQQVEGFITTSARLAG